MYLIQSVASSAVCPCAISQSISLAVSVVVMLSLLNPSYLLPGIFSSVSLAMVILYCIIRVLSIYFDIFLYHNFVQITYVIYVYIVSYDYSLLKQ